SHPGMSSAATPGRTMTETSERTTISRLTPSDLTAGGPLTARAVERAATADEGANDRAATPRARLSGASVDLELALHPAFVAASIDVVATRRAAKTDALPECPADRLVQTRDLGGAQRSRLSERMDARTP